MVEKSTTRRVLVMLDAVLYRSGVSDLVALGNSGKLLIFLMSLVNIVYPFSYDTAVGFFIFFNSMPNVSLTATERCLRVSCYFL